MLTRTFNARLPDPTRTTAVGVAPPASPRTLTPRQNATESVMCAAASLGVGNYQAASALTCPLTTTA